MKNISFFALAFAGASSFVCAESVDDSHSLEHVLISLPFQRVEAETALPVTRLSGEELRDSAAATLGETLDNHPGLSSASFGPAVGQPVIRGQQGTRVSVLQNSLLIGDASSLSADHGIAVEPLLADSIEVLRGPSTLLYGGGAIGGVVNVIDNRIPTTLTENNVATELRYGSVDDELSGVVRFDGSYEQFAFHFDGLSRKTNDVEIPGVAILEDHDEEESLEEEHEEDVSGFIPNTDSTQQSFTLGTSYFFNDGFVGVSYNQIENEYGIPPGSHEHEHEEEEEEDHEEEEDETVRIDMEKKRTDFRLSLNNLSPFLESLDWKASYSDYQHVELENGETGTQFNHEIWQNRVQISHAPIGNVHGVLGLQQSSSEFSAVGEEAFIPPSKTDQVGLFIVENIHTNKVTWEVGLRADNVELTTDSAALEEKTFNTVSAGASFLWHLSDSHHVSASYSYAQRAPVVEELLSNQDIAEGEEFVVHVATGAIEVGNTELEEEVSNNIDLSYRWDYAKLQGSVTVFYNGFADYIYLQNSGLEQDETPIYFYAQEGADFYGVEIENVFQLTSNVNWRFFADNIKGKLDNGDYVPRMPAARFGSDLAFDMQAMDITFSVVHALSSDDLAPLETETDSWTRLDATLNYPLTAWGTGSLAFLRLKNITDEEIRNNSSFLKDIAPEAGRSIEFGVRAVF